MVGPLHGILVLGSDLVPISAEALKVLDFPLGEIEPPPNKNKDWF